MAPTAETCKNCGRVIGNLEQPYVHRGHVVCRDCWSRLQVAPSAALVPQKRSREATKTIVIIAIIAVAGIIGALVISSAKKQLRFVAPASNSLADDELLASMSSGDINAVKDALSHDPNLDARDRNGANVFHLLADSGMWNIGDRNITQVADMLLARGAKISAVDSLGQTPLHRAAMGYQQTQYVIWLLSKGANPNATDNTGDTPLLDAAESGQDGLIDMLVQHGASVNAARSDGKTALHLASAGGHWNVVHRLIANGANVNAKDNKGYTPLYYAKLGFRDDVAAILTAAGGK
jgi:ankyrin repeat protein